MATQHSRSTNNQDANPDFVAQAKELLGLSDADLGLKESCQLDDITDNQKRVADALSKASSKLMKTVNKEDPWFTDPSVQDQVWPADNLIDGRNPLTMCEAQWVNDDYPQGVEGQRKLFQWVSENLVPRGCEGVETVVWRYDDPFALIKEDTLRDQYLVVHESVNRVDVLSAHCWGQAVCDPIRKAHKGLIPPIAWGDGSPFAVNYRSGIMMMVAGMMSKRLMLNDVIHGFCGGAGLWQGVYDFGRGANDLEQGFNFLTGMWTPILDFFEFIRLLHALEVHGTEAGFDWYAFKKTCKAFQNRTEWGKGHDGSHYRWQGIDPTAVIYAAAALKLLYHFHFKSIKFESNPLAGCMRGLAPLDTYEEGGGWWFETIGNGHDHEGNPEQLGNEVDAIVQSGYNGNVSAENEKPGADPEEQMEIAISNINAALYKRGMVTLPDA